MDLKEFVTRNNLFINKKEFDKVYDNTLTSLSISSIGKLTELFYKCGVDPLDFLTYIPEYYFAYLKISSVKIPSHITEVRRSAFEDCTNLKKIYYAGSINEWVGLKGIKNIYDSYDSLFARGYPSDIELYIDRSLVTDAIIDTATEIKEKSFVDYTYLKSITIGENVTNVQFAAFLHCKNLTTVAWNAINCKSLPLDKYQAMESAFIDCDNLKTAIVGKNVKTIPRHIFNKCRLSKIDYKGSVDDWANISNLKNLTRYTTNDFELYIGGRLLTSVDIRNATKVSNCAFFHCQSLKDVIIGNKVRSIGDYAFFGCSSLTSITIPTSVIRIGKEVIDVNFSFKDIEYLGTQEQWKNIQNDGSFLRCTIHCIDGDINL